METILIELRRLVVLCAPAREDGLALLTEAIIAYEFGSDTWRIPTTGNLSSQLKDLLTRRVHRFGKVLREKLFKTQQLKDILRRGFRRTVELVKFSSGVVQQILRRRLRRIAELVEFSSCVVKQTLRRGFRRIVELVKFSYDTIKQEL